MSRDRSAYKPLKSAGILGAGKAVQGVLSFAFLALAARTLGVTDFGYLVLIHGLVFGFSHILRAQSWQAVVRYGVQSLKDRPKFQGLIRYTMVLDIIAAGLGLVVVQGIILYGGHWFDLTPDIQTMAQFYAISIVFMIASATPFGVLRLFDRFDVIALQTLVAPIIRFVGSIGLFIIGGALVDFLLLWFVAAILSRLALFALSVRELHRQGMLAGFWRAPIRAAPGVLKFILAHNVSQGLFHAQAHFGLYLVAALLGPAAAGIYKIAEKFADILVKPASKFLVPAIYPELAKAKEDPNALRKMVLKNSAVTGGVAVVIFALLVMFGKGLIISLTGVAYVGAYEPMLWLCAAGVLLTGVFAFEPLLSSAGRIGRMMVASVIAIGLHFGLVFLFIPIYGIAGAAIALLISACVMSALLYLFARDLIRKTA